jgi:uncharacterized protein (DUF934 family)
MAESDPVARLWSPQGFREDPWIRAETPVKGRSSILPLGAYLALDARTRMEQSAALGVEILPAEGLDDLLPFLANLPLIALAFPAFNDGRSYSKAALLRSRHGYRASLRAAGDILIDQIALMLRTGFDEFEVTHATAIKRLAAGEIGGFPHHYQPSALDMPAPKRSYSWRRLPN